VGRSIGDSDAGVHVVPLPHMRQLLIPQQGVRVVLASDGLWDLMTIEKAGCYPSRPVLGCHPMLATPPGSKRGRHNTAAAATAGLAPHHSQRRHALARLMQAAKIVRKLGNEEAAGALVGTAAADR
jgi:hypothetical protein